LKIFRETIASWRTCFIWTLFVCSGAGKSTLIGCLNRIEKPDRGRIEIRGLDIASLNESVIGGYNPANSGVDK
jgi:ABC-type methionine transport system ATPase subunit